MQAKFIYENIHFERGIEPLEGMDIGMTERRQNEKSLNVISETVDTDISNEMTRILDILENDGIVIMEVEPEYPEDTPVDDTYGKSRLWVGWKTGNGREGAEEFAFVQFPTKIPKRWFKKFGKNVWDLNDPYESGHNAQVITRILQEMLYQTRTDWPGTKKEWSKNDWEDFRKELSFLKEK